MNELMDLPIFHDQRSSDKQIQIKTMHHYYSVYGIQIHKSDSCSVEKLGLAEERSNKGDLIVISSCQVDWSDMWASDSAHLDSAAC